MTKRGTVVREFDPYWRVVEAEGGHVVVDVSTTPAQKVHGPVTMAEAEAFCRLQVNLWATTHGQGEWP